MNQRLVSRGNELKALKLERNDLEEDLEQERERGKKLDSRISEEGRKIQDLKDKLKSQEQKLSTYDEDLKNLSKQKAELLAFQNEVRNSRTSNAELEGTLGKRKKDLDKREESIAKKEKTLLEGKEKVIKWRDTEVEKVKKAQDNLDEYKKQLDDERLRVSAENTEKIRATEEVIKNLEEKLAAEKQKFNEEMEAKNGELNANQNSLNNERIEFNVQKQNFNAELNEAQEFRKLWDQEQFVKQKLNRELDDLREREKELNQRLQRDTKNSLDLKTKLEEELNDLRQKNEQNGISFKNIKEKLQTEIRTLRETNTRTQTEKNNEIKKLNSEIQKINDQKISSETASNRTIKELEQKLSNLSTSNDKYQSEKKTLELQITKLTNEQKSSNSNYQKSIADLNKQIEKLGKVNKSSELKFNEKEQKLQEKISLLEKQQSETNTDLDAQILEIKDQLKSEQDRRQSEFMRRIKAQDDLQAQTKELNNQKIKIQELYEKLKKPETSEKGTGTVSKQTSETGTNPFAPDYKDSSVQNDLGDITTTVNSLTQAVEHYNNLHDILDEKNLDLQNTQLDIASQKLTINQLSTELDIIKYENRQLKEQNNDEVKIWEDEIQRLKDNLDDKTKAYNSMMTRLREQEDNLLKLGEQLYQKELELERKNDPVDFSVEDLRDFGGINKKYEQTLENIETMLEINTPQKEIEEMITTQINGLKQRAESLEQRLDKEQNPLKQQAYRIFIEKAELVADRLKMDFLDKKPDTPEMIAAVQEEVDNNPEVRFEKFKKFVKENFIGISGALIGIAGIVATIAVAIRNSTKTVGNTMQKSGSENSSKGGLQGFFWNVIKNLGKIISWTGDNIFLTIGILVFVSILWMRR